MTFIDTLRTSRKESSLYRRAAQTRSFLSWDNVTGVLRYKQVRASPGACLNQSAAARNKELPPLTFDIQSFEDIMNRSDENNTPIPSPDCTTNHLDYDCDNYFCPWYIENAIQQPFSVISSATDVLSTPQANTPFSSFSESTPTCSRKRKKISRKDVGNIRRQHVADWIDNKRKKFRNLGKEYKSRDGTTRLAKSLKPMCPESCRQKCSTRISSDERMSNFNRFWNLGNREKQWSFVAHLVLKQKKRRVFTDTASRRNFTLIYRLHVKRGDEDDLIVVCKKTFLNTFSISEQFVYTALEKVDVINGLIESDKRGRHDNHRKVITEDVVRSVCDHINSIQPVESHYTRSRSDKLYLDGDLNFHRLFDLYKEWFDEQSLLQGNWNKSDNGDKVQWNKIKEVLVKSENPHKLYYKYDMASNDYYVLSVKKNTRRQCSTDSSVTVEPLYQSNLPIPKAKKDDLINMCNSGIIPRGYHDFFTNLPSVLHGMSGSEITTTSPTLGDVLLPRVPAGFKGAAGTYIPIFAKSATPAGRANKIVPVLGQRRGRSALQTSSCKPRSMFKPDSGGAEQRIAAAHL
ncbi:hypothetical protein SFRURICE_003898 [Spodoptera frugiperda]|nr:hypothetical protein SFRURICE_003898 [Spodoptera frugiperda]